MEHVSHKDGQFTKIVPNGSKGSRVAGTQVLDRTGDHLKSYIPKTPLFKEIKCTWNNSCLDETFPNMAMVARSVGSWLLPMGPVSKAL